MEGTRTYFLPNKLFFCILVDIQKQGEKSMNITTVLFDLDGTLLPMDMDVFTNGYFALLTKKLAPLGYEPKKLVDAIWAGTGAMVKNDGSRSNEMVFWDRFAQVFGEKSRKDIPLFEEFYANEFQQAKNFCGCNEWAAKAVHTIKESGRRVVLATNPIFPSVATESRVRWVGLEPSDFELYTTYENCRYCKPNVNYYRDILDKLGLTPEECLMVGNDVTEDMVAQTLGMRVFLITDCLINKEGKDISGYPRGGFEDLIKFVCG